MSTYCENLKTLASPSCKRTLAPKHSLPPDVIAIHITRMSTTARYYPWKRSCLKNFEIQFTSSQEGTFSYTGVHVRTHDHLKTPVNIITLHHGQWILLFLGRSNLASWLLLVVCYSRLILSYTKAWFWFKILFGGFCHMQWATSSKLYHPLKLLLKHYNFCFRSYKSFEIFSLMCWDK